MTSSCYLFDDQGLLANGSKSTLMNEVANKHANYDTKVLDYSKNMRVGYTADVMANARKLTTKKFTNFRDFAEAIVDYIQKSAKGADRIDYIFDLYFDISIKNSERKRRETISPTELNVVSEETPIPVQMEQFWPANRSKDNLEILVHQTAINHAQETPSSQGVFVNGFSRIGRSRNGPCDDEVVREESYLVQVLKNVTTSATMDDLRDHSYHHSKASPEKLPPIGHAIKVHILRACYATHVMTSALSENSTELNPLLYGYDEEDELLTPDMGFRSMAESKYSIIPHLSKCNMFIRLNILWIFRLLQIILFLDIWG
ncbi:hypothetical protein SK128_000804 [Halocaridina rubra]|uniref:Uncharacterized protein n=1 Tax=Halocaridina rubra TaxID=373956 RepID=A0AAN9FWY1_HALRR